MTHNLSQSITLNCPQCRQSFDTAIWLMIDSSAHPELIDRIRAGDLHHTPCPHCHHTGQVDAPLLLYRPAETPTLIFSPAEQTSAAEDQEQAQGLLGALHHSLGAAWRDEWLKNLPTVPRHMLPAMLGDDPEAALHQMAGQMEQELERLRREDPEAYRQLEAAARQMAADDAPAAPPLPAAMQQFIEAETWIASYHFVQSHPELLGEEANDLLTQLAAAAQVTGDENAQRIFAEHQTLLQHCREIGVTEAFAKKLAVSPVTLATTGQSSGSGAPSRFQADLQQAQAAEHRHLQRGDRRGLDEAAAAWHRILDHPDFATAPEQFQLVALNNGGTVFLRRYWAQGQLTDLNRALDLWQTAVQCAPPDSPGHAISLNNLGNGLSDRYARTGQLADLEAAIAAYKDAVQRTPPDSPDRAMSLSNLGSGFSARYARTGQPADLEAAIAAFQDAAQRTPPDSPNRAGYLNNLGLGLRDRYTRTGTAQPGDLEAAIAAYKDAVQRTPPDSPDRAMSLNNLGLGLRDRYARTGQPGDLEAAIAAFQDAVQRTSPDSLDCARYLNSLGNGLSDRYARTGQLADLEAAIAAYKDAVQRTPPDSLGRAMHLNNLGSGLGDRYARTGQPADLEAAIAAFQEAEQRMPPESPDRAMSLNNLGIGFRHRYARTSELAHLEEAIAAYQDAVARTPPDSPDRAMYLNNLGNGLRARYDRTGQLADLGAAIAAYKDAVQRTPPDSPGRAGRLNNLGSGLRDRWHRPEMDQKEKDAAEQEGKQAYEQACRLGAERQPEAAVTAARSWGRWALSRRAWAEAGHAYQFGLIALETLYRSQLLQQDQQSWQREGQGLYAQAAYAQARQGNASAAATLLEQGQARGLNERLARDKADLHQVEVEAPAIFEQYQAAAGRIRRLEAAERQEQTATTPAPDWTAHRRQVEAARADLSAAVDAIRRLDNHHDFLQPPTWATLAAAVQPGHPLVYLITGPAGSLALLLHRPQTSDVAPTTDVSIEPLWADAFTENVLNNFLVKRANGELPDGYLPGQFLGGNWLKEALSGGLPLLGEKLLAPLAQRLAELGLTRVTLIPGGRLNLLPLHAAVVPINGRTAIFGDLFTVSYAPSASTLSTGRRRLAANTGRPDSLLAVGNPLPLSEGGRSLRFARPEAEEIALRFGGTEHLYCETAATHTAVAATIPGARFLHFSCHGLFDPEQPLNSGLILSNGERLTLRQVLDEIPLEIARLAVLSACQTAITDYNNLPDEFIGLPAGFLQAGVAGVLGSLWPVDDLSTAIFMDHFYRLHREEGQEPAEALQATQRWLRCLTVAELKTLFTEYMANAPDAPTGRMAYALAQDQYVEFTLNSERQATPYAEPYHWAAFAFYGV
jgi:CHAT domain-containing protein